MRCRDPHIIVQLKNLIYRIKGILWIQKMMWKGDKFEDEIAIFIGILFVPKIWFVVWVLCPMQVGIDCKRIVPVELEFLKMTVGLIQLFIPPLIPTGIHRNEQYMCCFLHIPVVMLKTNGLIHFEVQFPRITFSRSHCHSLVATVGNRWQHERDHSCLCKGTVSSEASDLSELGSSSEVAWAKGLTGNPK